MADYKKIATEVRRDMLTLLNKGHTSHAASNLSLTDIAVVLYENLKEEDIVIWSKGWASGLYYTLAIRQGILDKEEVYSTFPNYPYLGLLEPHVPGIVTAGGSVGHGLSVACGRALARKREGKPGIIYVLMSDGELNEGAVWEAAMFASHHKLDNLVTIIDKNGWQAMGRTKDVLSLDGYSVNSILRNKFSSFGWNNRYIDGHDHKEIEESIFSKNKNAPKVIICKTIKGKGVSFMEDSLVFHYSHVTDENLELALKEL
jgi:transketolase